MKKLSRIGFFAVALMFFLGTFAAVESDAQHSNKILSRMDTHQKALQSLEANVTMQKYDANLGVDSPISGKSYYLVRKGKDPFVRIDWEYPAETMLVANGKYILYQKNLKQAIYGKVSDQKNKAGKTNNALEFMSMSKRELRANYDVQVLKTKYLGAEKELVWHLRLTPKTKKGYKYAELWVDKDGMPRKAKVFEKNGDWTTVLLTKIKKNVVIKSAIFNWRPPKGTERI